MSLTLSPTQLSKAKSCRRNWWFDYVRKMPAGQRVYGMVFGDVLHAVVERWLRAGPDGRDERGREVDLYPLGWQWTFDRGGGWARIEPEDDEIVKRLVEKAISEGHLERAPGRQIERSFFGTMIGNPDPFGEQVLITGRIDYCVEPSLVMDHKTTKDMRYAASEEEQSPKYLGANDQLLLYARVLAEQFPEQQEFTIGHFIYDRTKVNVQRRKVTVTRDQVLAHWDEMVSLAGEMLALSNKDYRDEDWNKVPGALDKPETQWVCAEFKGCRYLDICAKRETPEKFRQRYLRLALPQLFVEDKEKDMGSLEEKLKALEARVAAAGEAAKPAETQTAQSDNSAKVKTAGPAVPGPDLTDKPVEEVLAEQKAQDEKDLLAVDLTSTPDQRTETQDDLEVIGQDSGGTVVAKKKRGRPKKSVENVTDTHNTQTDVKVTLTETVTQNTAPKDGLHVPSDVPTGPMLLHGCAVVSQRLTAEGVPGPIRQAALSDVLKTAVEEIGGSKLEDFYKADAFKRRDAFGQIGRQIAERFAGVFVLAPVRPTPDEAALLTAISPYSSLEIGARA